MLIFLIIQLHKNISENENDSTNNKMSKYEYERNFKKPDSSKNCSGNMNLVICFQYPINAFVTFDVKNIKKMRGTKLIRANSIGRGCPSEVNIISFCYLVAPLFRGWFSDGKKKKRLICCQHLRWKQ